MAFGCEALKKTLLVLGVILLFSVGLRLYPAVLSGMPFSTDAWSPIRNAELLMQNTPIPLSDGVFDGYNNYWPVNSIFGVLTSQVTSLTPLESMALFFPIVGALSVIVFYALVHLFYGQKISLLASLLFGAAFTHAYFTAGVTKETYASPLYLLLLFVFVHPRLSVLKRASLFTAVSVALTLTHHLTLLVAVFILISIALAKFVVDMKKGLPVDRAGFLLLFIPVIINVAYYELYAQAGMGMPFSVSDWISIASFQLLAFSAALYLALQPPALKNSRLYLITLASVALAVFLVLVNLNVTLVPGFSSTVQSQVLLFILPSFLLIPFQVLGVEYQKRTHSLVFSLFWFVPLAALMLYAVISNTFIGSVLWIRTPNFMFLPAAVLAAAGLYWLYQAGKKTSFKKVVALSVTVVVVFTVAINVYGLYDAVSLQDRYMGSHWLYTEQELNAGAWISTNGFNQSATGDAKVAYLLRDYFRISVNNAQGFRYLNSEVDTPPILLYTYKVMEKNGYVLSAHGVDLPANWTNRTSPMNAVYSNEYVNVYTRVDMP